MSLEAMCIVTGEEKYFKIKYRSAGVLRNVNPLTCLKCKLQLKFGNNYSFIIVNFHTFYAKQSINLNFSDKGHCKERTADWYIATSVVLRPLKHPLIDVTSFRLSKSRCS